MQKKSNNVQHFKLKPSLALVYFQHSLYLVAALLILFCSLEWFFKSLLLLLLALEYFRQNTLSHHNIIEAIQIRDQKILIKRKNDDQFQAISALNIKQNRIFAELELHLKDDVLSEFIYQDSFYIKGQFSALMQNLRFNHL